MVNDDNPVHDEEHRVMHEIHEDEVTHKDLEKGINLEEDENDRS